jgi:hypothetical protein
VSTHLDLCQIHAGASVGQALQQRIDRSKGRSLIDYKFRINVIGASSIAALDQAPELIQPRVGR